MEVLEIPDFKESAVSKAAPGTRSGVLTALQNLFQFGRMRMYAENLIVDRCYLGSEGQRTVRCFNC